MARKIATTVDSVQFSVTFDSTGFTFTAPPNSDVQFEDYGDGTYHLTALPDGYQIASNTIALKRPAKKKPSGGTKKKK